ncbi:MAG: ABC-F family ATP-binding cassette domain-containing protein [Desulfobacteraceae bacterium]|nr:ABC-F family ATP-binding cassette domain-containing protein [Desulfobacteraceae bacterium]
MGKTAIIFQNVSFQFERQCTPLLNQVTAHFPVGWNGIVGANGSGKTTLLQLAVGGFQPSEGNVLIPSNTVYCEQRTDLVPAAFEEFMEATDKNSYIVKGRLGIEDDWIDRWDSLSHGERKRVQIGCALWQEPFVLAVDEPTNHLDQNARKYLFEGLKTFAGIGLLVSHDRELLDTLCRQCLFLDPPDYSLRPGGYTKGNNRIASERETVKHQFQNVKKEYKKLEREANKHRNNASAANAKRSKKGVNRKDHDASSKINLARLTGKDAVAGKLLNRIEGRKRQASEKLKKIKVKKTYDTGIRQQGERSKRKVLFSIPEGSFEIGQNRVLEHPSLVMKPGDRIALTGDNGTGKSTLVQYIFNSLSLPSDKVTYIPQEIDQSRSEQIISEINCLPGDKRGFAMTLVNRLGSRPDRLVESAVPSPGEIRKILLAIGASSMPHLIIMDEPTNHLDLVSIECLEEAFDDFTAGLLLVSHDRLFLDRLTEIQWHIAADEEIPNRSRLTIH